MGLSVKSALMVVLVTRRNVAKSVAVALERKAGNKWFFLEGECQGVGALEKERNKTRKILIKRR